MFYQLKTNQNCFIYIEDIKPVHGVISCTWLLFENNKWVSWSNFTWLEELVSKFNQV